ncbi:hypothetical protein CMI42_06000 [Candidatus Pacearchaeota archaeon]|nr:hypothetical protein [Candidatus Pacearchaeota archaeon]|tara:strand:+ start:162 stop:350 length:189 start_codon:yes stop_codon:yes gene_type:complete
MDILKILIVNFKDVERLCLIMKSGVNVNKEVDMEVGRVIDLIIFGDLALMVQERALKRYYRR